MPRSITAIFAVWARGLAERTMDGQNFKNDVVAAARAAVARPRAEADNQI